MVHTPQISIIMATYNRAHFIAETLQSIQQQHYTHFECIIIDDGGTDNTLTVLQPFLKDKRFSYKKRENSYKKGLPGCRNYGLDIAKGQYIIFFDDDDIVHPQNLDISIQLLQEHKNANYCHYQKQSFEAGEALKEMPAIDNVESKKAPHNILEKIVTKQVGFASCTVLWKASCFQNIRFEENLQYAEEWECYTRIIASYPDGIITNVILYYNRKHPHSNTAEFYNGNIQRRNAYIAAVKKVISFLNSKQLLSKKLQKFFMWESVQMGKKDILKHLQAQTSLSFVNRLKNQFYYSMSPLIKIYLKRKNK